MRADANVNVCATLSPLRDDISGKQSSLTKMADHVLFERRFLTWHTSGISSASMPVKWALETDALRWLLGATKYGRRQSLWFFGGSSEAFRHLAHEGAPLGSGILQYSYKEFCYFVVQMSMRSRFLKELTIRLCHGREREKDGEPLTVWWPPMREKYVAVHQGGKGREEREKE